MGFGFPRRELPGSDVDRTSTPRTSTGRRQDVDRALAKSQVKCLILGGFRPVQRPTVVVRTSRGGRHYVDRTSCRRPVDVVSTSCRRPSAAAPPESCPESSISLDFCEGGSGWGSGSRGGNSQVLTLRQASEYPYEINFSVFLRKVDFVLVFTCLLQCQNLGVRWGNWMGRRHPMRGFAGSDSAKGK